MDEFDFYANDYDVALARGVSISGENAAYFAEKRVEILAGCLQQLHGKPETVLDFGCGTGTASPYLLKTLQPQLVLGVDVSAKSLAIARQSYSKLPVMFKSTGEHTPDGTISLAYCNGVFHHIPLGERVSAIKYIADCIKPGGLFAMWENNPWSPAARIVMRRIPFDRDAVMVWPSQARSLARAAGFNILSVGYHFIFPRQLSLLRPSERCLACIPFGAQYQLLAQKPL